MQDTLLSTDYLSQFDQASREDIDKLLWDKLSEALDDKHKTDKIANLLTKLRRAGRIYNTASRRKSNWVLKEDMENH